MRRADFFTEGASTLVTQQLHRTAREADKKKELHAEARNSLI
jgi:hypothetical protein